MGRILPRSPRTLGLIAILTSCLGFLYAPFHAAAYLATPSGSESPPLVPWDGPFRASLPWAFDFASPDDVYVAWGRLAPVVVFGFVMGLLGLLSVQGRQPTRVLRFSFYSLLATQSILCASTVVEYYTPFLGEAFMVGFPAFLLGLVSYLVFAIASLRANTLGRGTAWLFIVGAAAVIPLIALFGHIPLAMYGLYAAWTRVGFGLQTSAAAPLIDATPSTARA